MLRCAPEYPTNTSLHSPLQELDVSAYTQHVPSAAAERAELQDDTAQHMHSVHMAGLSPALMHLKPNKACLELVDAMLQVGCSNILQGCSISTRFELGGQAGNDHGPQHQHKVDNTVCCDH